MSASTIHQHTIPGSLPQTLAVPEAPWRVSQALLKVMATIKGFSRIKLNTNKIKKNTRLQIRCF